MIFFHLPFVSCFSLSLSARFHIHGGFGRVLLFSLQSQLGRLQATVRARPTLSLFCFLLTAPSYFIHVK
uniref:Putative secreted protein n=1 Tax=Anopheles darlingi TaxID=43151 RepID=A0A2M4D8F5_ANODA